MDLTVVKAFGGTVLHMDTDTTTPGDKGKRPRLRSLRAEWEKIDDPFEAGILVYAAGCAVATMIVGLVWLIQSVS